MSSRKRLIIFACGVFDINLIDNNTDVLAFTTSSMAILDKNAIEYMNIADFISREEVVVDTNSFMADFRKFISVTDAILETKNVQNAFLSSAFWILVRLSGLRFISILTDIINDMYSEIVIVGECSDAIITNPNINWNSLSWQDIGGPALLQLKHGLFNVKCVECHSESSTIRYKIEKIKSIILRIPELLYRRANIWLKSKQYLIYASDSNIWVAQGGYDVDILKLEYKKTRFKEIDFTLEMNQTNKTDGIDYTLIRDALNIEFNNFLYKWFPHHRDIIIKMFWSYLYQIVAYYPFMVDIINKKIACDKPIGVLYSVGSENILEELIATVAIQNDIPVYFFKHSSIDNIFVVPSVFDPYFEKNSYIKRVQFLSSVLELKDYDEINNVRGVVSGGISRPELFDIHANNRKILYSVGPPNCHTFKEMGRTVYDKERYDFANMLLQLSCDFKLYLDIKIHPAQATISYDMFQSLLDDIDDENLNILPEGTIERIMKNYGLVVLDMLSTRVLSSVLYLKIPVVVFVPTNFPVHDVFFEELKKRVYIVNNYKDIESVFSRFVSSNLPDLYSDEFNRKFMGTNDIDLSMKIIKRELFGEE